MPSADTLKTSWADEVEEVRTCQSNIPPPKVTEEYENGFKVVTEILETEENQKVKVVRTYKLEKRVVSKTIALRKTWTKYGKATRDPPGPNPATTLVAEDTFMQFLTVKDETDKIEEDLLEKLKGLNDKIVKCRLCNGDHWTLRCPFKGTPYVFQKALEEKKPASPPPVPEEKAKPKYVAPGLREGARKSDTPMMGRQKDEMAVRISNLPETTQEADIEELVEQFGPYHKLFLAKDKATGMCKGFAYVHFKNRQDAAMAIASLNKYGYYHLILNVEWSKSQNHP